MKKDTEIFYKLDIQSTKFWIQVCLLVEVSSLFCTVFQSSKDSSYFYLTIVVDPRTTGF